jgi:hypothetical protein
LSAAHNIHVFSIVRFTTRSFRINGSKPAGFEVLAKDREWVRHRRLVLTAEKGKSIEKENRER